MAHQNNHASLGRTEPTIQRMRPRLAATALITALVTFNVAAKPPAQTPKPTTIAPEIAEKQADLGELRGRIDSLRKELNTSEESKADAASRLRDSERKISTLQRELHEFSEQRRQRCPAALPARCGRGARRAADGFLTTRDERF